ncbi:polysaccharide deacetylase family protein [Massilicoli timonensis]|uniref:Polysaccharide deacetylase family protein n=1 Tax=Massilicoli timonensis TaxID=2015901 RepID=A0ABT1SI58_9FIRM|nr:polysaccharide deacetylase family protein [Massilicoli timonensis]MCQ5120713.1 polysaccharide deacetylase family protein [Massilicoli timonensis]HIR15411.1 polysaccharide deacetylase family protein [Candidatus Onthosoma merdavium]
MKKRDRILIGCLLVLLLLVISIMWMSREKPLAEKTDRIAILGYHHLAEDGDKYREYLFDPWTATLSSFERQMRYLKENGYHTISLDELYEWYEGKRELDSKAVVITFDDSYYSTYELAKPILEKYGFEASTFVIGYSIPYDYEKWDPPSKAHIPYDLLQDDRTMRYYSHFYHLHRKIEGTYAVNVYSEKELIEDIKAAKEAVSTDYMAYPYGKYNDAVKAALRREKVKLAFSYHQYHKMKRSDDAYELPRFSINAYTPMFLFRWYLNQ